MLLRGDHVFDITNRDVPTMRDLMELDDIVGYLDTAKGEDLGPLQNTVRLSTECPEWTIGIAETMRNLAGRGLL